MTRTNNIVAQEMEAAYYERTAYFGRRAVVHEDDLKWVANVDTDETIAWTMPGDLKDRRNNLLRHVCADGAIRYYVWCGSFGWGMGICPISEAGARSWVEAHIAEMDDEEMARAASYGLVPRESVPRVGA